MSEKLQQAITSIKSGNQQLGLQLLAQVLQEQPDNELGWLWMSAVVSEDKRRYCIERVLKINPNNQQAKQALHKLDQIEAKNKEVIPSPLPRDPSENISPRADESGSVENEKIQGGELEKPKLSITKAALRDGIIIGVLSGLLTIPLSVATTSAASVRNAELSNYSLVINFAILLSTGIATGIVFFRRKIGANIAVSVGGGLSGFIAGTISGLTIAYLTNGLYWSGETNRDALIILLICGSILGISMGIFNSLTVWLPGLFIKPDKRTNREKLDEEFKGITKLDMEIKPVPVPTPAIGLSVPKISSQIDPPAVPLILQETRAVSAEPALQKMEPPPSSATPFLFWINPTRKTAFVIALIEDKLFTSKCPPSLSAEVGAKLSTGKIPVELLTEKITIPFTRFIKLEENSNSLRIDFRDHENRQETVKIECEDKEMADAIVNAIQQRFQSELDRETAPMSIGSILLGNGILITIILAVSAFFYYGAADIRANDISPTGSARTRGIIVLLDALGPGGVACIGGGLMLLILISMTNSLIKPPLITTLSRKNINRFVREENSRPEIKQAEPIQKIELQDVSSHQVFPEVHKKNETLSPLTAALSDGVLAGLVGGLLGLPLHLLYLLTGNDGFNSLGIIIDILIFLFVGIAVGILFYQRKLPRGTSAIVMGGGCGGAIAGAIFGFVVEISLLSTGLVSIKREEAYLFVFVMSIFISISTSIFAAATAWIPGLFIKADPNVKPYDWRDGKTEMEVARIENYQARNKSRLQTRFIVGGVAIAIIFISTLCNSLVN